MKRKLNNNIYYYKKINDECSIGSLFSYTLYSPQIEIFHKFKDQVHNAFSIERGYPADNYSEVKRLAIEYNKDEIIFPKTYIEQFKKNSLLISQNDFSIQVYDINKLVRHASVLKNKFQPFKDDPLYLLMQFIVHEDYRHTVVKEILLYEIKNFIPKNAALYLQVFSNNQKALNFFLKRMNVSITYEKMVIQNE